MMPPSDAEALKRNDDVVVLDAMSDVSTESGDERAAYEEDEGDGEDHVMDPSDPRAHGRVALGSKKTSSGVSRWDVDSDEGESSMKKTRSDHGEEADDGDEDDDDDEEEEDEDLGVPIVVDDDDNAEDDGKEDESMPGTAAIKAKLSNWAISRFLVPRKDRKLPELEEPPLEPLNDFILSDFGTRFRGKTGDVEVQRAVDAEDEDSDVESSNKFLVGAPLFSSGDAKNPSVEEDDSGAKGDKKPAKDGPTRKRKENRYFITDLATKCFNCGQVGHVSAVCANDKVQKPCYYCGLRGHSTFACPHLPCSSCLQLGHEARDCTSRRLPRRFCELCGRANHDKAHCTPFELDEVSCMVCHERGHLHCVPIPPAADRRMYCPQCAGGHTLNRCPDYVTPAATSFSSRLPRADMKCFLCNGFGHIAAECPKRSGYNGGNSCFNCGERGHYASNCTARNSGRKRSRREFYADEEDEEDEYPRGGTRRHGNNNGGRYVERSQSTAYEDDSDDDGYYVPQGRGGSNHKRPRYNHQPRLDAPLPTYRQNGGGGNRSGNQPTYPNSSNGRRRWR